MKPQSLGQIPRRGEIWWVQLNPTRGSEIAKTRPCVVMSSNILNERRRTVVVVPLSSSPRPGPPLLVPVNCAGRNAVAVLDQLRAVSKERLENRMGELTAKEMKTIEQALREILELD